MSMHNIHFLDVPKYLFSLSVGRIPLGLRNKLESAICIQVSEVFLDMIV